MQVNKWCASRESADLAALDALAQSGASPQEICDLEKQQQALKASWPAPISIGQSGNAVKKLAERFAAEYGYSMFSQDKPTRHLPRDHPQVQHVNDFINMNIKDGKVDARLVANWDQVWSCLFEPMRKTLWKDPETGRKDSLSRFPKRQLIRSALQEHFGETVEMSTQQKHARWKVRLATIKGYGGANTVNCWRSLVKYECIFLFITPHINHILCMFYVFLNLEIDTIL